MDEKRCFCPEQRTSSKKLHFIGSAMGCFCLLYTSRTNSGTSGIGRGGAADLGYGGSLVIPGVGITQHTPAGQRLRVRGTVTTERSDHR